MEKLKEKLKNGLLTYIGMKTIPHFFNEKFIKLFFVELC